MQAAGFALAQGHQLPAQRHTEKLLVAKPFSKEDQRKMADEVSSKIAADEAEKESVDEKDAFGRYRVGHHRCAHPHEVVPRDKSWLRAAPPKEAKKSKLVFGITNTQRLRMQKTNPQWLKSMERAELVGKTSGRGDASHRRHDSGDELNVSMSDTLTEVRRQAQKELEKPALEDTLASSMTSLNASKRNRSKSGRRDKRNRSRSSGKGQSHLSSVKPRSPKTPVTPKTPHTGRSRRRSEDSDAYSARPHSVDPSVKNIFSPEQNGVPNFAAGMGFKSLFLSNFIGI
jgi:hypothetical protein